MSSSGALGGDHTNQGELSVKPPQNIMALSAAQGNALLVLLEAPSKQAVDAFFCSCFRERHVAGPIDDVRVAEIVESLALPTPSAAAPLQRAAVALIGKVLYVEASAEQTAALFPPDFHSSLQALLTKVRPRWRCRKRCHAHTSAPPHTLRASAAHPRTRAPAHPRTRAPAHPRTRAPAHLRTRAHARATAPYALTLAPPRRTRSGGAVPQGGVARREPCGWPNPNPSPEPEPRAPSPEPRAPSPEPAPEPEPAR
jgi:hypothetical protein